MLMADTMAIFFVILGLLLAFPGFRGPRRTCKWWLRVDSNHRPQHYECCALTG